MKMELVERFLSYVKIETTSDPSSEAVPSSSVQWNLAKILEKELMEMGLQDVYLDKSCIVYGTIPANLEGIPTVGFIAHMDTSPDASGAHVEPRIIENYDGKDIALNENTIMRVETFPSLASKVGNTLIVTNGTTLLGADDKAGIAEIMDFTQYLMTHPEVKHGTIKVAFTPDEEVGRGTENFDVEAFGCDFAYTVDGGEVNLIEYENFNAASAIIDIQGVSVHPGSAKNKMINASLVGMKFNSLLKEFERPEYTEGFEGFNHLTDIQGDVEHCHMEYIIRNHDAKKFGRQKKEFDMACAFLNSQYEEEIVHLEIKDSYRNMVEILKDHMEVVELAWNAIENSGLKPQSCAIRGGTDGANLTFKGLPCPNLGTGGYNYHGRFEYAVVDEMKKSVEILKNLNACIVERFKK